VSIKHALKAKINVYDRLFMVENPTKDKEVDFIEHINPNSHNTITGYVEPILAEANVQDRFQFQRIGYFCLDKTSTSENLVFNKTVGLRDSWKG
jgi:glutaminyl-tRNA synthetase